MSPSPSPTVTLTIVGKSPMTELSVHDADFHMVSLGASTGKTQVNVPPGLYVVTFREGAYTTRQIVAAERGTVRVEQGEAAPLPSSIPFAGSPTTHEWHEGPAMQWSRDLMDHDFGGDSDVFLFVRDVGDPTWNTGRQRYEWPQYWSQIHSDVLGKGVRLIDGGAIDLEMMSNGRDDLEQHWCALTARVPAGTYLLRVETPRGVRGMPIAAVSGWATHVFIRCSQWGSDPAVRGPDLATATITMRHMHRGFDPDPDLRLVEQAQQALSAGRPMSGEDFDQMLRGKFFDPMLGLVGAHLLCRRPSPDLQLLDIVLENLRDILGTCPDLAALELRRDRLRGWPVVGRPELPLPPMIADAFEDVVELAMDDPGVVQSDTMSAMFARSATRAGPWLVASLPPEWRPPDPALLRLEFGRADHTERTSDLLDDLQRILKRTATREAIVGHNDDWYEWLDEWARAVLVKLYPDADPGRRQLIARTRRQPRQSVRTWSLAELSRALRAPSSVVAEAIARLHTELSTTTDEVPPPPVMVGTAG